MKQKMNDDMSPTNNKIHIMKDVTKINHRALQRQDAHKNNFGHVWIFGGSVGFTGAPRLAAEGAMATGVGLVSIICPQDVWPVIAACSLEVMVHPQGVDGWKKADVILVGPGWGNMHAIYLAKILSSNVPLVLDADALNMIALDKSLQTLLGNRKALTILTPHAGEAGRLLGKTPSDIQTNRLASVLALVDMYQCAVILKGAGTLLALENKEVFLCPFGSSNLARAGTGDVLAGMVASLLAQAIKVHEVVNLERVLSQAIVWHARAGESNDWYRTGQLPSIIASLLKPH